MRFSAWPEFPGRAQTCWGHRRLANARERDPVAPVRPSQIGLPTVATEFDASVRVRGEIGFQGGGTHTHFVNDERDTWVGLPKDDRFVLNLPVGASRQSAARSLA